MSRMKLTQGDTKPPVVTSLTDKVTGDPIDVSQATVLLKFRKEGSTTLQDTITAILLAGVVGADGTVNTNLPYNTEGKGGRVQFDWGPASLAGEPGDYEGEIEITFPDGTQSVYETLKFHLREQF